MQQGWTRPGNDNHCANTAKYTDYGENYQNLHTMEKHPLNYAILIDNKGMKMQKEILNYLVKIEN